MKKYSFTLFAITSLVLMGCAVWLFGTQFIWIPLLAFSVLFIFFVVRIQKPTFDRSIFIIGIAIPVSIGLLSSVYQFWGTTVLPDVTLGLFLLWVILCIACILGLAFLATVIITYARKYRLKKRSKRELAKRQREAEERAYADEIERENLIFAIKQRGGSPSWKDTLSLLACRARKTEDWKYVVEASQYSSPEELITISVIKKTITWKGDFELMLGFIETVFVQSYDDTVLQKIQTQMQYFVQNMEKYDSFKGKEKLLKEVEKRCPQAFSTLVENA